MKCKCMLRSFLALYYWRLAPGWGRAEVPGPWSAAPSHSVPGLADQLLEMEKGTSSQSQPGQICQLFPLFHPLGLVISSGEILCVDIKDWKTKVRSLPVFIFNLGWEMGKIIQTSNICMMDFHDFSILCNSLNKEDFYSIQFHLFPGSLERD